MIKMSFCLTTLVSPLILEEIEEYLGLSTKSYNRPIRLTINCDISIGNLPDKMLFDK